MSLLHGHVPTAVFYPFPSLPGCREYFRALNCAEGGLLDD
jgi:hypothetical protein